MEDMMRPKACAKANPGVPLTALIVGIALLAGCSDKKPTTYQGYVEGEFVYIASSQAGRLDRLSVARGQQVSANAPMFLLEAENEAAAQRQAQEQLQAAQAQLEDLKIGKRPQELNVTRAQLAQAIADQKKAAEQLTRDEAQYQVGGIAKGQLDDTRAAAASSAAHVRELRSQLEVATLPSRTDQIRAQSAQVAAARATLEQANWKLGQKAVNAPRTGIVYDTMYRVGEWVQAGNPVVRMLPPENVKVRFFVPETIVGSLSPGQAVIVRCDGCKATVPATVTYINAESEYTPPVIYSNDTRAKLVYMIEARPSADNARSLHPGQPVEVTLR
jgi:HlyD family secretion protein